ncbi:MAG: DUF3592 domain-containing protein [Acutalibacteraceae bacterium]
MSLFDRRTDTEKELEAYQKRTSTNERQSPFDKYNNTENTQNNTKSDSYNYSSENYNTTQNTNNINQTNTYRNTYTNTKSNKKHTVANIIIAILVVLLICSFIGMFVLANIGYGALTFAMFGQIFFLFGIIGFISNLKSGKKSIVSSLGVLIFSLVGLFMMAGGFLNGFAGGQTMMLSMSYFLGGKLIAIVLCSVFVIVGAVLCISANVKRSKQRNNCNVSVMAEIIDVKVKTSRHDGHTTRHYAPVYRYYYGGREYIKDSDIYTSQRVITGSQTEILINPNDANDIYEPQRMSANAITSTIIGSVFMIMGIFVLISFLR